MIYTKDSTERNAVLRVAEAMCAAARTAPKACGVDKIETLILDGRDKAKLTEVMSEMGKANVRPFFIRDAGNVDESHCIVLIGADVKPRGLNCGLCGVENCEVASKDGISCTMAVNDLGIAGGSAAAMAMDNRIDNRMLFSAGMAALKLKLFPDNITVCFGIGLATTGKNIFFDRTAVTNKL